MKRAALLIPAVLVLGACGGSSETSSDTTSDTAAETTSTETTASVPAETTTSAETETTDAPATGAIGEGEAGIPIGDDWEPLSRAWFVYDVADDDTLNVRSAPGAASDKIGEIEPDVRGITVYSPFEFVDNDQWVPIQFGDGAGWVAGRFLRPLPVDGSPTFEGDADDALLDVAATTVGAIEGDPSFLAELASDGTLVISLDTYVDTTGAEGGFADVTLTQAELASAPGDERTWGQEVGTGGPIDLTQDEMFERIAGSTAITSTEVIGVNVTVGSGSTINNLDTAFPGADIVEYHFAGTETYGGLDWQSVRLVFDSDTGALLAIVTDEWSP